MIEVRMGGSNGRSQERQEAGTSGGGGGLCTGKGKDSFRWENPMITLVFEED